MRSVLGNSMNAADFLILNDRRVLPKVFSDSSFVTDIHWRALWSWIPKRYKSLDVELLFSAENDGYRLLTMYRMCADREPQILFIQTTTNHVFGAYMSDSWSEQTHTNSFFGSAETFLFTFDGEPRKFHWTGLDTKQDDTETLQYVHENASLYMYGDHKFMAIGGGGLYYGLSLDDTLQKGMTGRCLTFANLPLLQDKKSEEPRTVTFVVKNIEVWTLR